MRRRTRNASGLLALLKERPLPGRLSYCIGDIHGCLDKLTELVRRCHEDAASRPMRLLFLGDYVDRGPDSCGVIQFLLELQRTHPGRDVFLKGNHEDLLAAAADSDFFEERWLSNGGSETLKSYGVTRAAEIPRDHVNWLRRLGFTYPAYPTHRQAPIGAPTTCR